MEKKRWTMIVIILSAYIAMVELACKFVVDMGSQLTEPAPEGSEWWLRLILYIIAPTIMYLIMWAASPDKEGN